MGYYHVFVFENEKIARLLGPLKVTGKRNIYEHLDEISKNLKKTGYFSAHVIVVRSDNRFVYTIDDRSISGIFYYFKLENNTDRVIMFACEDLQEIIKYIQEEKVPVE